MTINFKLEINLTVIQESFQMLILKYHRTVVIKHITTIIINFQNISNFKFLFYYYLLLRFMF